MRKMKIQYIFLTIVFCLSVSIAFASDNDKTTLNQFLFSKNESERQKAFNSIINNGTKYKNLVLTELQKYEAEPDKTPDALLYLAAFIKDQRYVQPLSKLINNDKYSSEHCIYSCPIVFSLTIITTFANCSLPILDDKLIAVQDLKSEIKRVKNISIKPEEVSKYVQGPGIDKVLQEMESLPLSDVIKIAGQNTATYERRVAAAYVLSSNITTDQYIKELYWLAITHIEDASHEYEDAIYLAIYRAETYRKRNK